jgi:hypothetical protein
MVRKAPTKPVIEGSTFNEIDKSFIESLFDKQCQFLAEIYQQQNEDIQRNLSDQTKLLKSVNADVSAIMEIHNKLEKRVATAEGEIEFLKEYTSFPNLLMRSIAVVLASVGVVYLLYVYL